MCGESERVRRERGGPVTTNVVSLGQPGAQGDTEDNMETEDHSLTVPGQGNNHTQLPDTTSIRNYSSDIHYTVNSLLTLDLTIP